MKRFDLGFQGIRSVFEFVNIESAVMLGEKGREYGNTLEEGWLVTHMSFIYWRQTESGPNGVQTCLLAWERLGVDVWNGKNDEWKCLNGPICLSKDHSPIGCDSCHHYPPSSIWINMQCTTNIPISCDQYWNLKFCSDNFSELMLIYAKKSWYSKKVYWKYILESLGTQFFQKLLTYSTNSWMHASPSEFPWKIQCWYANVFLRQFGVVSSRKS